MKHDLQDPPRLLDTVDDPMLRDALRAGATHKPSAAQLEALAHKVSGAIAAPGAGAGGSESGGTASAGATQGATLAGKLGALKLAVLLVAGAGALYVGASWLRAAPVTPTQLTQPTQASDERRFPQVASEARRPIAEQPRTEPRARTASEERSREPAIPGAREVEPSAARASVTVAGTRPRGSAVRSATSASASVRAAATARGSAAKSRSANAQHAVETASVALGTQGEDEAAPVASAANGPAPRSPVLAPAQTDVPPELTLLGQAQRALARDPAAALERLELHAATYPHGSFAEEREALAIDALRRLGRTQEMRARIRTFLTRYPASPHRDRIEQWAQ